jgi:hypothetical protein
VLVLSAALVRQRDRQHVPEQPGHHDQSPSSEPIGRCYVLRRSFDAQPPALASGSDLRAAIAGQIEALKTAIKESQSNSNVLSELAARSSGDVANTLQTRMMAALDEFKAALEHAIPEKLTFAGAAEPPAVMVHPAS